MTASLQLSNRRVRHYHVDAGIGTLLAQLGLDYSTANFWSENSFILDEILHDAFVAYRERIIQVSPRASGDDQAEAAGLNALWSEIKRRFHQHMHPQIIRQSAARSRVSPQPKLATGQYARFCAYKKCGCRFVSTSAKQIFCCDAHKSAAFRLSVAIERRAAQPPLMKKCELERCKVRFRVTPGSRKRFHHQNCKRIVFYQTVERIRQGCLSPAERSRDLNGCFLPQAKGNG
jgi:hypothetical protein